MHSRILLLIVFVLLAFIAATQGAHKRASAQTPSPPTEATSPSLTLGETVDYINQKLAANPTPWWKDAGCYPGKHQQFFVSVEPEGRFIYVHEVISDSDARPHPCELRTISIPAFNLGYDSHWGKDVGATGRSGQVAGVRFSCAGYANSCIDVPPVKGWEEFNRGEYYDLELLSDDETLRRVSRAVVHLVDLLKKNASPKESDPFAK